jgi:Rieske Fe-S protein
MNGHSEHVPDDDRRGFLTKAAAVTLAAAAYAAPAGLALLAFVNPWRKRRNSQPPGEDRDAAPDAPRFVPVALLSALSVGGAPQEFPVVATRQDAWTSSTEPIGRVFLIRTGKDTVRAFQVLCPHAGCPITFHPDKLPPEKARPDKLHPDLGHFACTCHTNPRFDLAGRRFDEPSGSPRDLDELETRIGPRGEVLVRYETFRAGTAEKIAVP